MAPPRRKNLAKGIQQKHAWTLEDRTVLAVLYKFYDTSRNETASIFNHLTQDRLLTEGILDGLAVATIEAQLNDMKRTSRGEGFREIQSMGFTQAREKLHSQKHKIELAAESLAIPLKLRLHPPGQQKSSPLKRGPAACRSEWNSSDSGSESEPGTSSEVPTIKYGSRRNKRPRVNHTPPNRMTPCKRNRAERESTSGSTVTHDSSSSISTDSNSTSSWVPEEDSNDDEDKAYLEIDDDDFPATARRMNPRLRIRFNNKGKLTNTRPRLLFRAFDPNHKLRAREFLSPAADVPSPPEYQSEEFERLASRHLSVDKTFKSPFLSFTESPNRALKIIEKAKHPLSLAIVDYNILEEDMAKRFGKSQGLWLVPEFCKERGIEGFARIHDERSHCRRRGKEKPYTGWGEFLVWASVECLTVAVLNTREALSLKSCMDSLTKTGKVGYESGEEIALHLSKVRVIYREIVAYKLLRDFAVSGYRRGSSGISYEEFVRGVYGEKALFNSSPSVSPSPEITLHGNGGLMLKRNGLDTSARHKGTTSLLQSRQRTRKVKISVEVPLRRLQTSEDTKSTLYEHTKQSSTSDGNLQRLVDAQISEMGSLLGIIVETPCESLFSSVNEPGRTLVSESESSATAEDYYYDALTDQPQDSKVSTTDTETAKTEETTTKSEFVEDLEVQNSVNGAFPETKLEDFEKELLEYATILTPTLPPQFPLKPEGNVAKVCPPSRKTSSKPLLATPSQADPLPQRPSQRSFSIDRKKPKSATVKGTPRIVETPNKTNSDSKQSGVGSDKQGTTRAEEAPKLPPLHTPIFSRHFIDLTNEEDDKGEIVDDVDDDDDEPTIIAAARIQRRRYVRTRVHTGTSTLTIRSRSLSETISFNSWA